MTTDTLELEVPIGREEAANGDQEKGQTGIKVGAQKTDEDQETEDEVEEEEEDNPDFDDDDEEDEDE